MTTNTAAREAELNRWEERLTRQQSEVDAAQSALRDDAARHAESIAAAQRQLADRARALGVQRETLVRREAEVRAAALRVAKLVRARLEQPGDRTMQVATTTGGAGPAGPASSFERGAKFLDPSVGACDAELAPGEGFADLEDGAAGGDEPGGGLGAASFGPSLRSGAVPTTDDEAVLFLLEHRLVSPEQLLDALNAGRPALQVLGEMAELSRSAEGAVAIAAAVSGSPPPKAAS